MNTRKQHTVRRIVVLAAVLALLIAFESIALAVNMFGLRDLLFPNRQSVSKLDENGIMMPGETVYVDMISLSGYAESPAARAHAEWREFLNGYDLAAATEAYDENVRRTGQTDPELLKYADYDVYDRDMANKLADILARYGLNLRGEQHPIDTTAEWAARMGGDFAGTCRILWGYMYDDGSCFLEGESVESFFFQFSRAVKTSFNDVSLNISDIADYEQWMYQTACGESVLLCLGSTKSLVFGDFPDCFVSINVLSGREEDPSGGRPIDKKGLEALADTLNFSLMYPVVPFAGASSAAFDAEPQ